MIREAMTRKNWTQVALAKHVGLSPAYVSDILAGNRQISHDAAKLLCPALDLKPADVLKQQVDDILAQAMSRGGNVSRENAGETE